MKEIQDYLRIYDRHVIAARTHLAFDIYFNLFRKVVAANGWHELHNGSIEANAFHMIVGYIYDIAPQNSIFADSELQNFYLIEKKLRASKVVNGNLEKIIVNGTLFTSRDEEHQKKIVDSLKHIHQKTSFLYAEIDKLIDECENRNELLFYIEMNGDKFLTLHKNLKHVSYYVLQQDRTVQETRFKITDFLQSLLDIFIEDVANEITDAYGKALQILREQAFDEICGCRYII